MSVWKIALASVSLLGLSACASMDLPEFDFMEESEFSDEVAELDSNFPSPEETPDIPTDVRSAAAWDQSAREMEALYDQIDVPELEPGLNEDDFDREFETAQQAAEAYKADDPS